MCFVRSIRSGVEERYPGAPGLMNLMHFSVYILKSEKKEKFYVGHTNNIVRRLKEHNDSLRGGWTRSFVPWVLVFKKDFQTRAEAMREEKYLKSLKKKDSIQRYLMEHQYFHFSKK